MSDNMPRANSETAAVVAVLLPLVIGHVSGLSDAVHSVGGVPAVASAIGVLTGLIGYFLHPRSR